MDNMAWHKFRGSHNRKGWRWWCTFVKVYNRSAIIRNGFFLNTKFSCLTIGHVSNECSLEKKTNPTLSTVDVASPQTDNLFIDFGQIEIDWIINEIILSFRKPVFLFWVWVKCFEGCPVVACHLSLLTNGYKCVTIYLFSVVYFCVDIYRYSTVFKSRVL